jgi:hypothetical protein
MLLNNQRKNTKKKKTMRNGGMVYWSGKWDLMMSGGQAHLRRAFFEVTAATFSKNFSQLQILCNIYIFF